GAVDWVRLCARGCGPRQGNPYQNEDGERQSHEVEHFHPSPSPALSEWAVTSNVVTTGHRIAPDTTASRNCWKSRDEMSARDDLSKGGQVPPFSEAAFEAFHGETFQAVWTMARRLCGDESEAHD